MAHLREKLAHLISLGHWEVECSLDSKMFTAVFIGKYKRYLIMETSKLVSKTDVHQAEIGFRIFLPSFTISGEGVCNKTTEMEGLRNETVIRFMIDPNHLRVKQQRCYKRLPVLEKASLIVGEQSLEVVVKDCSLDGIGLLTMERVRGEIGIIEFPNLEISLKVVKVHEFTDFNLFQYGMKIEEGQNTQKFKEYLFSIQDRFKKLGILL